MAQVGDGVKLSGVGEQNGSPDRSWGRIAQPHMSPDRSKTCHEVGALLVPHLIGTCFEGKRIEVQGLQRNRICRQIDRQILECILHTFLQDQGPDHSNY